MLQVVNVFYSLGFICAEEPKDVIMCISERTDAEAETLNLWPPDAKS